MEELDRVRDKLAELTAENARLQSENTYLRGRIRDLDGKLIEASKPSHGVVIDSLRAEVSQLREDLGEMARDNKRLRVRTREYDNLLGFSMTVRDALAELNE